MAPVTAMGVSSPQKLHLTSPLSLSFDNLFLGVQLYFHFSSAKSTQPTSQIRLGKRNAGVSEMGTHYASQIPPARGGGTHLGTQGTGGMRFGDRGPGIPRRQEPHGSL